MICRGTGSSPSTSEAQDSASDLILLSAGRKWISRLKREKNSDQWAYLGFRRCWAVWRYKRFLCTHTRDGEHPPVDTAIPPEQV
ncbi:hypothetical protein GDO81_024928 [Engystomops pustulosus]|uniref:Uncharacterized protein n=1 Tax=Engystomops pustulosus TaxID=76066 RepID=A0AAV6Z148_ENGPU|nr:hypothetical protein GDO81_024928 [Engystomops pustulosus]